MICPRVLHSFAMFFHIYPILSQVLAFFGGLHNWQLGLPLRWPRGGPRHRPRLWGSCPAARLGEAAAGDAGAVHQVLHGAVAVGGSWGKLEGVLSCFLNGVFVAFRLGMCSTYWSDCSKSGGNIRELSRCCFLADVFLVMGESQRDPVVLAGCPKIWRNAS
jgi:hypothetical protein